MNIDIGTLCLLDFNEYGLIGQICFKEGLNIDGVTQCQNILKINEERGTLFNHHAVHKAVRAATELEICNKRCI